MTGFKGMPKKTDAVAKLRILVERDVARCYLLSRKRKKRPAKRGHGKLEMLGGHLDLGERPEQALIRECREEERTGRLAEWLADRAPRYRTATVDGAVHHLFDLTLAETDAELLEAHPDESLGFHLVPAAEVDSGVHDDELTYRTRLILAEFGPAPR